jgi:hypothetical protein
MTDVNNPRLACLDAPIDQIGISTDRQDPRALLTYPPATRGILSNQLKSPVHCALQIQRTDRIAFDNVFDDCLKIAPCAERVADPHKP